MLQMAHASKAPCFKNEAIQCTIVRPATHFNAGSFQRASSRLYRRCRVLAVHARAWHLLRAAPIAARVLCRWWIDGVDRCWIERHGNAVFIEQLCDVSIRSFRQQFEGRPCADRVYGDGSVCGLGFHPCLLAIGLLDSLRIFGATVSCFRAMFSERIVRASTNRVDGIGDVCRLLSHRHRC